MKRKLMLVAAVSTATLLTQYEAKAQTIEQAIKETNSELFDNAQQTLKQLINQNPTNPTYDYYLGNIYFQKELYDSAGYFFKQGLAKDNNSPLNLVGEGKIKLAEKKNSEAKSLFTRAIELAGPKNVVVREEVVKAYIEANVQEPSLTTWLDEALKVDNKNAKLHLLYGDAVLLNENNGTKAISSYNKAQELEPKSPEPKLHIGKLWVRSKSYDVANENYKEAIALDPNFAPAYAALADLYFLFGRAQQAKDNYATYKKLVGNTLYARVKYAKLLFAAKSYEEAIPETKGVLAEIKEPEPVLYRILAYSEYETKQYAEGLQHIETFLEKEKADRIISSDYVYYGKLLAMNGREADGIVQLEKALAKDSTNLELLESVADAYIAAKDYVKAAEIYNKKIRLLDNPTLNDYYKLAQAYYRGKEYEKADSNFKKVTENSPTFINAYLFRGRANNELDKIANEKLTAKDTLSTLAAPHYKKAIELAEVDEAKNKTALVEAYYYFATMYYKKAFQEKSIAYKEEVKAYNDKVLALEPENKQAIEFAKTIDKWGK